MQTLSGMLDSTVKAFPKRALLVTERESVTYSEFAGKACQVAGVLSDEGVQAGEAVGILLPSGLELAISYWGLQKLGAIPIPLNPMYRPRELEQVLSAGGFENLITDVAGGHLLESLTESGVTRQFLWHTGDDGSSEKQAPTSPLSLPLLMRNKPEVFRSKPRLPEEAACMFFTSGTTGAPKAVIQTQKGQMTSLTSMFVSNRMSYGEDVVLNVMPLFNNFGMTGILNSSIFAGATVIHLERWDPRKALELMTQHKVTLVLGTPTIYVDICEHFDSAHHDLSTIKTAITAGAGAPPSLIQRFDSITGVKLRQIYGATETHGIVTAEPHTGHAPEGSIGQVVGDVKVRILDEDARELPTGEIGELVIEGAIVSPGYLGDVSLQESYTSAGWRSGDLGYVDEQGYYFLVDRKKDMIICGGNNIFPAEIESVLSEHPDVVKSAVVGIPDERRGEIPVAVVTVRRNSVDAELLEQYCRGRIAAYKVPRKFFIVDDIPVGSVGKIQKNVIKDRIISQSIHG